MSSIKAHSSCGSSVNVVMFVTSTSWRYPIPMKRFRECRDICHVNELALSFSYEEVAWMSWYWSSQQIVVSIFYAEVQWMSWYSSSQRTSVVFFPWRRSVNVVILVKSGNCRYMFSMQFPLISPYLSSRGFLVFCFPGTSSINVAILVKSVYCRYLFSIQMSTECRDASQFNVLPLSVFYTDVQWMSRYWSFQRIVAICCLCSCSFNAATMVKSTHCRYVLSI